MRLFPSLAGVFGVASGFLGLVLATTPVDTSGPGPLKAVSQALPNLEASRGPVEEGLAGGPWFRSVSVVRPVVPVPGPVEVPVSIPQVVDRQTLSFVGKVVTEDGTLYYFKEKRTAGIIGLLEGQPKNGWTLVNITDSVYLIEGPGGSYEVRR